MSIGWMPEVKDAVLTWYSETGLQHISVETDAWYQWLERASRFSYSCTEGTFTARKEMNKQNSIYWRAYRKRGGKLYRAYLGKSETLTLERLRAVACRLAGEQEEKQQSSSALVALPPAALTRLLGREAEIAAGKRLLADVRIRLLTITGPGGVGKTRVALELAAQMQSAFSGGVFWVELAPVRDATFVLEAIVQALSLQEDRRLPPLERLKRYLYPRQMLLVLDNFEQVISAAPLLVELLTYCPRLTFLVTSREVLHVRGEHELLLSPLALPEPDRVIEPERAMRYGAIALFMERAQTILPDFQITAETMPYVVEICCRLDGLPLAIELAAARLRLFPLQDLHERLTQRLSLLTNGPRDLPERQQTLRATLQWSYDLLTPEEQRFFRLLASFVGGCSFAALEAIYEQVEAGQLADLLTSLLNKHLLMRREQEQTGGRFVMLETVREFGMEQLLAAQEFEQVMDAQAAYYVRLVEEALGASTEAQDAWFDRLEDERENLHILLQWLVERGKQEYYTEMALRLAGAVARFWCLRWYSWYNRKERYWVERALLQRHMVSPEIRARALQAAAWLAFAQDDGVQAECFYQESLSCYQIAGNQEGVAAAYHWLGYLAWTIRQDGERAYSLLSKCAHLAENGSDLLALAHQALGIVALEQGNFPEALLHLTQSVALFQGQRKNLARALRGLGRVYYALGQVTEARHCFEESLKLSRETKDHLYLAFVFDLLGQFELIQGTPGCAQTYFEEALTIFRLLGTQRHISRTLLHLADVAQRQGAYEQAHARYRESLDLLFTLSDSEGIALCLQGWGSLAAQQKQFRRAAQLWGAAAAFRTQKASYSFSLPLESLPFPCTDAEGREARVRRAMGQEVFEMAWREGHSLSPQQLLCMVPSAAGSQQKHVLSKREIEVLRLVAQGQTDAQIAEALVISPRTVHAHMRSIYTKLGISSRFAAIRYALDAELL
ncbi:putative ATPase [Thermosporothrix hazakensis]|jgi:predicted ATPase/DNA-binding CsgD family transcriptional regulator|uniref:Putative ATPase n=1 Tax=Thermosporothrix hazakensis TaxID=644383 RepID=A0A326TSV9_THEHA|nr:tetratricopeptide repeat protein [Thermosporothrix hazakensis]PZW19502.1 putative ATPase [Thermosporothrix hazakensis]GCE51426.1 hypothetical protein KTH_62950 [Thermosporothrix hazakensis]